MIDALDADVLAGYLLNRDRAEDEAVAAYWAGRIDSHCLQNAIAVDDLRALAADSDSTIDWATALESA
jgi:hypothetical protein